MTSKKQAVANQRMSDLVSAMSAVIAFHFTDRDGAVEALRTIPTERRGDALLAVGVIAIDQAARAAGLSWESTADAIMAALLDPDERDALRQRIEEESA